MNQIFYFSIQLHKIAITNTQRVSSIFLFQRQENNVENWSSEIGRTVFKNFTLQKDTSYAIAAIATQNIMLTVNNIYANTIYEITQKAFNYNSFFPFFIVKTFSLNYSN